MLGVPGVNLGVVYVSRDSCWSKRDTSPVSSTDARVTTLNRSDKGDRRGDCD